MVERGVGEGPDPDLRLLALTVVAEAEAVGAAAALRRRSDVGAQYMVSMKATTLAVVTVSVFVGEGAEADSAVEGDLPAIAGIVAEPLPDL